MKKKNLIATLLPIFLILSACNGTPSSETMAPTTHDATAVATDAGLATATVAANPTLLPASDGPFLLIQTGANAYEIIDFALGLQYPVDIPLESQRIGISGSLSPSKTLLKLPINDNQISLLNFLSGNVQTLALPNEGFNANQTAELAQAAFEDLGLSFEAALDAVQASYTSSIANLQWFRDDDHLLAVTTGSPTSTQLASVDMTTGEIMALESLPDLVESFSRSGDWILLKKGLINEPGYARDDQYYVLNLTTQQATPLTLPADADNPILGWFDGSTLSIIHESQPIGGINFSTLDVSKMTNQMLIEGQFSSVQRFQDGLLIFRSDLDTYATLIQLTDLNGLLQMETTLSGPCSPVMVMDDKIIVNCETESLILDSALNVEDFGDPIFSLTSSPDGKIWVRVNRSGQTSLLGPTLAAPQSIDLEGAALEVRWLPDCSAFLYRTLGKLYRYDLTTAASDLLLESDLLGDYANINAAWITIPE